MAIAEPSCGFTAINSPVKKEEAEEGITKPQLPSTPSSSPKKRQRHKTANDSTDSPSKKKPMTPSRKTVPACLADASEADKMLLRMKDVDGKSWGEISQAWNQMTGESSKADMVRMRYKRMKTIFAVVDEADIPQLVDIKKEVEAQMETEKWSRIAGVLESRGGARYDAAVVQKLFRERAKQQVAN
ncbi:hypothetical protein KEM56_007702 [Ascosphaera pollenicola]|nr:hypothetical protein KEM56_007702 [Ascosphaera pollenicola]